MAILKNLGATVNAAKIEPFAFDAARNLSLGHVPEDADICVCTDLDDYFADGWRETLENAWEEDTKRANYPYYYWGDGERSMAGFKIHARNGYKWVKPIHEYLEYTGENVEKQIYVSNIKLVHTADTGKSREFYFGMIEEHALKNLDDLMGVYNLVREYHNRKEWQKCVELAEGFCKCARIKSNFQELIGEVERRVGCCYFELGKRTESYAHFHRSIAETPQYREPYVDFAIKAYNFKDYELAFAMAATALKITQRYNYLGSLASSWDTTLDDYAAMSCYQLGFYQKAIDHAGKTLEMSPGDKRLEDNMALYKRAAKRKRKRRRSER
jgi:tetratricopeptide (TPR) repeat protein